MYTGLRSYGFSSGKELSINGRRFALSFREGIIFNPLEILSKEGDNYGICNNNYSRTYNRTFSHNKKRLTAIATKLHG